MQRFQLSSQRDVRRQQLCPLCRSEDVPISQVMMSESHMLAFRYIICSFVSIRRRIRTPPPVHLPSIPSQPGSPSQAFVGVFIALIACASIFLRAPRGDEGRETDTEGEPTALDAGFAALLTITTVG